MDAANGQTLPVHNPATGEVVARVPQMGGIETRAAIAKAAASFPSWAAKTGKERAEVLKRWYQLVLEASDDLANIMTMECGKPKAEAKAEFAAGVSSIEWFAEEAKRVCGDVLASTAPDRRMLVLKQPIGVVGAITPWNFPFSMITRKVAPALAAGCTVVLKPAEFTPLTAFALAELAERAGVPPGVLSVLCGDAPAIGQALLQAPEVRKMGFTGSTPVGKTLMAGAAQTVKRVSLELGGNAPFIVFDDADLAAAAAGVAVSALRNAGQTCICTNRVFVHDSVYDQFAELLVDKVRHLKMGSGMEPGTTLGPLISPQAVEKVVSRVEDAVLKGASIAVGGSKPQFSEGNPLGGGNFFEATVLKDATIDMRVFREEMFGPVVPLFRFTTDDEVVTLANDTEYGLAGYFYTRDLTRAWRVAERLEYGMIGVNEVAIGSEVAPFGGLKQSGLGREQSKYGLDEFLEIKYVCMGLP